MKRRKTQGWEKADRALAAQMAEVLRVSVSTLDRMLDAREVPCLRVRQQVRFTPEHVEQVKRDLAVLPVKGKAGTKGKGK